MGILSENHTFFFRHVVRVLNTTTSSALPSPCYRFTGSGDRPCDRDYTPLEIALVPWIYPARIDSMLFCWSWSLLDVSNPYVFVDSTPRPTVLRDHAWIEVARYAERTSYVGSDGGGYGLWFWVVPGSGVRVNIGRAVRFDNKFYAIDWGIKRAADVTLNCETSGMASCLEHADTYICAAARMESYDSVIIWRDPTYPGSPHYSGLRSDVLELIVCPKDEPPEQTTACPTMLSFRNASGGPCTCNEDAELLTCIETGDFGRVSMANDYGTRPVVIIGAFVGVWTMIVVLLYATATHMCGLCRNGAASKSQRPSSSESTTSPNARTTPKKNEETTEASLPLLSLPSNSETRA
jgi:hypothetical protein